jgi:hypothetical protein
MSGITSATVKRPTGPSPLVRTAPLMHPGAEATKNCSRFPLPLTAGFSPGLHNSAQTKHLELFLAEGFTPHESATRHPLVDQKVDDPPHCGGPRGGIKGRSSTGMCPSFNSLHAPPTEMHSNHNHPVMTACSWERFMSSPYLRKVSESTTIVD